LANIADGALDWGALRDGERVEVKRLGINLGRLIARRDAVARKRGRDLQTLDGAVRLARELLDSAVRGETMYGQWAQAEGQDRR